MKKIIECIPNFSEGRDRKKIAKILKAITAVPGILLLDHESDPSHNRSVVTFAGDPEAVIEGAFQGIKKAAELIDLDKHEGEHPRMGATDVCPLVPLKGVTDEECTGYAEKLGKKVGNELNIPVYLYEKAARNPERKNLPDIRRGQYEGIKAEIESNPERKPDYGPGKMPKAGATAIGVRAPLVAYNVNLDSDNLKIAKTIAKKIRFKNGGFPCVKAMGFELEERGIVQVSMNLTDYRVTPIHIVFDAIKKECKKHGVKILESEIIGLVPQEALIKASRHYLKIKDFSNQQILEQVLAEKLAEAEAKTETKTEAQSLENFLNHVASKNPVPGGGSVSALAGALAAALASMVANLTLGKKKYENVEQEIKTALEKTEKLRKHLYQLIEKDNQAYREVLKAYKSKNPKKSQQALKGASKSPLAIAHKVIELLEPLRVIVEKGNPNAITDCGVALYLTEAALEGAILNIKINLKYITDTEFIKKTAKEYQKLQGKFRYPAQEIRETVEKRL